MSTRSLIALLVVLVLATVVWTIALRISSPQGSDTSASARGIDVPPPQPPARPADTVAAQNPNGFQALISYTERGFEPKNTTIKVGETVRFTNNSSADIWVAAGGEKIYPAVADGCGSSALDSCTSFAPGRYWEFTFSQKGTWVIVNNLDKSKSASIHVQ